MKNKTICISSIIMCILLHMSIHAQDALTFDYNCETGCIDLVINGGFEPYEVEWQQWQPGQGWTTITGWPKMDLAGNDGEEDLCNITIGAYKVIVKDALCGTVEKSQKISAFQCLNISFEDKQNVSSCNGPEPDLPGSSASESCDGSIDISIEMKNVLRLSTAKKIQ